MALELTFEEEHGRETGQGHCDWLTCTMATRFQFQSFKVKEGRGDHNSHQSVSTSPREKECLCPLTERDPWQWIAWIGLLLKQCLYFPFFLFFYITHIYKREDRAEGARTECPKDL